jgi:hypothetical protein
LICITLSKVVETQATRVTPRCKKDRQVHDLSVFYFLEALSVQYTYTTIGISMTTHRIFMAARFVLSVKILSILGCSLLLAPSAFAQGDGAVYKCRDTNGTVMFTNSPPNPKACEKITVSPVSTIPAPKLPPRTSNGNGGSTATPANFPRVDSAQQKARDEDRRDLLNEELAKTESKCTALKKEYNNGEPERQGNERNYAKYQERLAKLKDDVARCDADITALKKEIALLK